MANDPRDPESDLPSPTESTDGTEPDQPIEPPGAMDLWVEERHRDFLSMKFRVRRVLFADQSPYQRVEVVESEGHGRMLFNDGLVMVSERDEFVYHEMLAHVPLFLHPNPASVLVVGGGDGGTAREVLRHPEVERCRMVEIDEMVVEACRRFLPGTTSAFGDPRLTVSIQDAIAFVAETPEQFDVVLVDSSDPVGPAEGLFNEAFYRNVDRVLAPGGIVVAQGESPFYEMPVQRQLMEILHGIFPVTSLYNFTNLTYPGGLWSFAFASRGIDPVRDLDPERIACKGLALNWYNAGIHRAAFALPEFMIRELGPFLERS